MLLIGARRSGFLSETNGRRGILRGAIFEARSYFLFPATIRRKNNERIVLLLVNDAPINLPQNTQQFAFLWKML